MALPQLYASCLLYRLVSVWCSSGVSSVAFLLLGGASVAALASDWTGVYDFYDPTISVTTMVDGTLRSRVVCLFN